MDFSTKLVSKYHNLATLFLVFLIDGSCLVSVVWQVVGGMLWATNLDRTVICQYWCCMMLFCAIIWPGHKIQMLPVHVSIKCVNVTYACVYQFTLKLLDSRRYIIMFYISEKLILRAT